MKALVFGGAGQDGFYLIEHLIEQGHEVVATRTRPAALLPPEAREGVRWLWSDLRDDSMVASAIVDARPDVVFNLAAVTTPGASWLEPATSDVAEVNAMGALRVLRAVERFAPSARLVHASSSAVYDPARYGLYGASKVFAHEAVKGYRSRGLWAANAVLYSHTSVRQDSRFLVPYVCRAVARIRAGSVEHVSLRDPGALRDWMDAADAVRALVKIAGQAEPGDFDVATGVQLSHRAVVEMALDGSGLDVADVLDGGDGPGYVERPADLRAILATGWWPGRPLRAVVAEMVQAALTEVKEKGL